MDGLVLGLAIASALGCGLMAGVFFAFSAFVMKGLARLNAHQGIAAMQAINEAAITPVFMAALFGTAALCLALLVFAIRGSAYWLVAGAALYLVGIVGVTAFANVPRNQALASSTTSWSTYVQEWTAWNHVRSISGVAAALSLIVGLIAGRLP